MGTFLNVTVGGHLTSLGMRRGKALGVQEAFMNGKIFLLAVFNFTFSFSIFADDVSRFWDFNGDGKEDIWYEDSELSYLEYLDRNYDGDADLRTQYDAHTNWPIYGASDDDFDGVFETRHAYKDGIVYAYLVDSNKDQCYDIIHYYHHQVIFESKKIEGLKGKYSIETIDYKFDFPVSTKSQETELTLCEFHKLEISNMPSSQIMPTQKLN